MKIRILSDLHVDVNRDVPFNLKDKDTFTVICGDTSGDPKLTKKWISENIKNGLFISGNHLVYNKQNKSISTLRDQMSEDFGPDKPVTYLDCLCDKTTFYKKINGILFIGTTLYTDFLYSNNDLYKNDQQLTRTINKSKAERTMNDYNWGKVFDIEHGNLRRLNSTDCEEFFLNSMSKIRKLVEETEKTEPNTPIFIVTHHCPSPKCISPTYNDSDSNASYVSNLENFITSHPAIKCWACGHVHSQGNFKVGDCLVVMNPRGYCHWCEDENFNENLTINSDTWEIDKSFKKSEEEIKEFHKRFEKFKKWSSIFI